MNGFIPEKLEAKQQHIPWFEEQTAAKIPGRGTEKSQATLKAEIVDLLSELGADNIFFQAGKYPDATAQAKRYGYQINFTLQIARGRIDCAALPIQTETEKKKDRALAQALYLLRDELQAMVFAVVHKPGALPLVPYLIGAGGKTVTETLVEMNQLALLDSPKPPVTREVLIGEYVKD